MAASLQYEHLNPAARAAPEKKIKKESSGENCEE
jgi:hypothetical protein